MEFLFEIKSVLPRFRLLPANIHHVDGKKHFNTVPVRLLRPQNTGRKQHVDRSFAKAVVNEVEEFACLFDPDSVCYLSQDDKARVPIGLPAVHKQTPMLMHLEYKVIRMVQLRPIVLLVVEF